MSYLTSNLVPGEQVIYQTRLHWVVMLGNVLVGCLLLAGPGAALLYYATTQAGFEIATLHFMQWTGVALIVAGMLTIILGLVRRNATEMAVTNRRVIVKTGLVSRRTIEMLLNKVESIEVSETTMGRLLGYGAIVVVGTGGSTEPFRNIAHPLTFRSRLQQQIEKPHLFAEEAVRDQAVPTSGSRAAALDSAAR
jgi:uncharacterized membrane protein YdbT with pleckstrin-like domain